MTYQLCLDKNGNPASEVRRNNDDGSISYIPENVENIDWVEYLAWLAVPNTPDPA